MADAERTGDLGKAAQIRYGLIPQLEGKMKEVELQIVAGTYSLFSTGQIGINLAFRFKVLNVVVSKVFYNAIHFSPPPPVDGIRRPVVAVSGKGCANNC